MLDMFFEIFSNTCCLLLTSLKNQQWSMENLIDTFCCLPLIWEIILLIFLDGLVFSSWSIYELYAEFINPDNPFPFWFVLLS